jgi:hypothetical protein
MRLGPLCISDSREKATSERHAWPHFGRSKPICREYAAQDAGTPVMASLHADCARLSRYHPGLPEGSRAIGDAYDPRVLPPEMLAEREPVAPTRTRPTSRPERWR